jgi:hypothetical protein
MAAEDERLEIAPERAVEVRETRTLFRLAPVADNDLGRSSRPIAIIAADTEEDARQIASMHDALCSAMPSFGPSRLRSKPESGRRSGDDMERRRFSSVSCS